MNEHTVERKPIGNSLRFKVFNRDRFTCKYCGKQSGADVILEIDHVIPVVKGGTNDIHNLVTACFECNRGKSKKIIDASSVEIMPSLVYMKQHRQQVKEFFKYVKFLKESENNIALLIWNAFGYADENDSRITSGFKAMIHDIGFEEVLHAANITSSKEGIGGLWEKYKYFCGICRNKKEEKRVL